MKESYPVQLSEYDHHHKLSDKPEFKWWVPHVLKKWERIIAKVKSKYCLRIHKVIIIVSKTLEE